MSGSVNRNKLKCLGSEVTKVYLNEQLLWCIAKVEANMERFGEQFPSAAATDGIYRLKANDDWTNGFWTGMLWLCYEQTGKEKFKNLALKNIASFEQRLTDHFVLDHHDIGFLYSLSVGAGYKITGDKRLGNLLVQAADVLSSRFQVKGQFIQAWGALGDEAEYRLIIDSLINLPLLYRASELTGNLKYRHIADCHYDTVLKTVIKSDYTTFHTYYFSPDNGLPLYGKTHQGQSDASIWARGQSWAILGLPLVVKRQGAKALPEYYEAIVHVFLNHLPTDLIPYWDFVFNDVNPSYKDSSALAIVANGLLESVPFHAIRDAKLLAAGMAYQLSKYCTSKGQQHNEGLLTHGVYAYPQKKGIDEPNIFGDYFYFALLMKLVNDDWDGYW